MAAPRAPRGPQRSSRSGAATHEPLYRRIERDVAARIRRAELPAGSLVPSERQLCERYGVSAITVRRALLELTRQGLIYRQAGLGTFVADPASGSSIALAFVGFDAARWRLTAGSMGELIGGVSEVAWRRDCTLQVLRMDGPLDGRRLAYVAEETGCRGLLLRVAGNVGEEALQPLDTAAVPYVLIRRYVPGRKVSCVVPADEVGVRLAVRHLAALGHRRVALCSALPEMVLTRERLRGYLSAIRDFDLEHDERLVRLADHYGPQAGYQAAVQALSLAERPSAMIVDADMAAGVYQAAADLHLDIPRDLAVVGYDEVPEARSLVPRLTCVRTSHYETGTLAAEALFEHLSGRERGPRHLVVEPVLAVRASCGAPVPAGQSVLD